MPAPIIVGIDGSAHAWRALDWAVDHAVRRRLPLHLVHGARGLARYGDILDDMLQQVVAEREDMLEEARRYALKQQPDLEITKSLVANDPASALEDASEDAALVAVGSRGLGGFEGLLFGSVGLKTAARAHCPVLVVTGPASYPGAAPSQVVVGIKGQPGEDVVVRWAYEEAESRGARLLAVHAVGGEFAPKRRVVENMQLASAVGGMSEDFPDVEVKHLVSDDTAQRALLEASEHAALIVVGATTRKKNRIGMVLGRVNHAALHHSHCPVVIVPTEE